MTTEAGAPSAQSQANLLQIARALQAPVATPARTSDTAIAPSQSSRLAAAIGTSPSHEVEPRYEGADKLLVGVLGASIQAHANLREALGSLEEIAAHIKHDTGWSLDLRQITLEVVDRKEYWAMAMDDARARMGITPEEFARLNKPGSLWGRLVSSLAEAGAKRSALACYLPSQGKVLVVRDNALKASADGLREILFHELIHAAQSQIHPAYIRAIGAAFGSAIAAREAHGEKSTEYLDAMDTVHARMAWLEGQPTHLQLATKKERFPESSLNPGFTGIMGSLVSVLTASGRAKVMQYIKGKMAFETMTKESPELIEQLFAKPQLVDVLLKTRGEVVIKIKATAIDDDVKQAASMLDALAKKNQSPNPPTVRLEVELQKA